MSERLDGCLAASQSQQITQCHQPSPPTVGDFSVLAKLNLHSKYYNPKKGIEIRSEKLWT